MSSVVTGGTPTSMGSMRTSTATTMPAMNTPVLEDDLALTILLHATGGQATEAGSVGDDGIACGLGVGGRGTERDERNPH